MTEQPLRIGLLLCDHLDPDVSDGVGDYPSLYPARFDPVGLELVIYEVIHGEFPDRLDDMDGWIVSGSRHSTYDDDPWIGRLEILIRELVAEKRPLVGICFGHQLIAQALGGAVERAEVGWGVGVRNFDVVERAGWMDDSDRFGLLVSHRDQVTRLPDVARLLATADYSPIGAYCIDDHVYCVQGHPEWVPTVSRRLMEKRRPLIGDDVVDAALVTLDGPMDQDRVAGWIARFFRGRS